MAKRSSNLATPAFTPQMRFVILKGRESFLRQHHTGLFRGVLEAEFGEIEEFRFQGESVELAAVLDELRSYGLMQQHKLVIVDEAEAFVTRDENRKALERYAERPVDHATLLLRSDSLRPGNLDKKVKKIGVVVACDEITDAAAATWCGKRAKKTHGVGIDAKAAAALIARVGTGLARLDTELLKLATIVEPGGTITTDAVIEMVGKSREEEAWEIQEAVLTGRPEIAIRKLRDLLEISRRPEVMISWSLIDLARKIHAASQLLSQRVPEGAIAKRLRLWGPAQTVVIAAARRVSPRAGAQLLQAAIDADVRMKSGGAKPARSVEGVAVSMTDRLG